MSAAAHANFVKHHGIKYAFITNDYYQGVIKSRSAHGKIWSEAENQDRIASEIANSTSQEQPEEGADCVSMSTTAIGP